ncbi:MAG: hypothetical protein LBL18_01680 [Bacteroidales bacterium]|jgi:hypothetical protein|nr:hypothetical protein [Bacteroidales bacterium]
MKRSSKHSDSKSLMYAMFYIYADAPAPVMKRTRQTHALVLLACLGAAICTEGCVKQHDCNCDRLETGKFVYLKEPYKTVSTECGTQGKIVAHFFKEGELYPIPLSGYVPIKFRSSDTIKVSACYQEPCDLIFPIVEGTYYYKLKCIERR